VLALFAKKAAFLRTLKTGEHTSWLHVVRANWAETTLALFGPGWNRCGADQDRPAERPAARRAAAVPHARAGPGFPIIPGNTRHAVLEHSRSHADSHDDHPVADAHDDHASAEPLADINVPVRHTGNADSLPLRQRRQYNAGALRRIATEGEEAGIVRDKKGRDGAGAVAGPTRGRRRRSPSHPERSVASAPAIRAALGT